MNALTIVESYMGHRLQLVKHQTEILPPAEFVSHCDDKMERGS